MKKNVKLGIFFLTGLVVLVLALYFVGARQNLFESTIRLSSCLRSAAGLQVGSSVNYVGIPVGTVEKISIQNDSTVCISMALEKKQAKYITKDATVQINTQGLMGTKIVSIIPGTQMADRVDEGDELQSKPPVNVEDIMSSIHTNSKNLETLTDNISTISQQVRQGEGLLGKLLMDEQAANQMDQILADIKVSSDNINRISLQAKQFTSHIQSGEGPLGSLIYDRQIESDIESMIDTFAVASSRLEDITKQMEEFTHKMNNGEGALSKLVNDTTMGTNLDESIAKIDQRAGELEETIDIVNNSWLLNLFSKNKDED